MVAQHEGFEEPARVREMPFGRRCVGHRLRARIGVGQRRREALRERARRGETPGQLRDLIRSEEHTSELQSLMRISYAVFCLKKKNSSDKKSDARTDVTQSDQKKYNI